MGKTWDGGDIAFRPDTWAAVFRVLKPGAHLLAFSGTRTQHRMVCAIEDAGFEIRDQIGWAYSSGFPKSHNLDNLRGDLICGCEPAPERDLRPVRDADVSAPEPTSGRRGPLLQPSLSEQGALKHSNFPIMSGAANPAWKGGVTLRRRRGNYVSVRYLRCPPHLISMARRDGYVMEHRLVMAEWVGRPLTRTEVVHHVDHKPLHNEPGNLELWPDNRSHKLAEHGRFVDGAANQWFPPV
jgi:hypothetical protein